MLTVGLVLAGLAAALHVYIFSMESLAWTRPSTRAVFGTSAEEAETTKELAFNQGFYNLFLAVVTGVGIALTAGDCDHVGRALVLAGCGSMAAAAAVLVLGNPARASAAIKQGLVPLLAVVAIVIDLAG
jgi:putative membrane protein